MARAEDFNRKADDSPAVFSGKLPQRRQKWIAACSLILATSMSRRWVQIAFALGIGVCVTIITSAVARALNSESARDLIFWPNTVLQYLVPVPNVGAPDQPLYEGTPLNFLAFLASFPFAILVYGVVAYALLRCLKT
jgi:hypothetical protein